ncbi:hypothetical protein NPIL_663901 [Nephila pilipes]|uniref:Uncharacterized protein n=1 Tax=Nephila pilipes TaxID=299642 RepID=A0A8X6UB87_NEPPI|nr:hypothetical protein NPIL_663901 [Nephila pilipes]
MNMDMINDMELTTMPTTSPASSPIPIPQGESPCLTRRKFAMEMEVLNLKIISQTSLLENIKRYPQYEETQLFQNELTILQAKRDQMVSAFQTIDPCEIIGCPHHSHINLTPRPIQINNLSPKKTPIKQTKRKDENGIISPPLRKTAKINQNQIPTQNLLITSNRFQNLNQLCNDTSDSHVSQAQQPITVQIPNVSSLPPPIMLKITKNYREQLELSLLFLRGEFIPSSLTTLESLLTTMESDLESLPDQDMSSHSSSSRASTPTHFHSSCQRKKLIELELKTYTDSIDHTQILIKNLERQGLQNHPIYTNNCKMI